MNASKENAKSAKRDLWEACEMLDTLIPDQDKRNKVKRKLIRVDDFLELAESKLPSEAAYARDKERRAAKK